MAGHRTGEDSDDLQHWLEALEGAPDVHRTVLLTCDNAVHGADAPTWFYVEGDASKAIARRRCLGCGKVKHLLDSEDHWSHPPMHSCGTCGQSMFEVAVGLHIEGGEHVRWLAVGVRCVGCGMLDGLTDMTVPSLPVDETLRQL
jgi:hypothetical protein